VRETLADGTRILHQALQTFATELSALDTGANAFSVVPTQGTLSPSDWANELHPTPDGFGMIADRFLTVLRSAFPGRI